MMTVCFWNDKEFNERSGGIQKISREIGDYFEANGVNVIYLSATNTSDTILKNQYFLPNTVNIDSTDNYFFVSTLIEQKNIGVIINQRALDLRLSSFILRFHNKVNVISVLHSSPLLGIKNLFYTYSYKITKKITPIIVCLFKVNLKSVLIELIYRKKNRKLFKLLLQKSKRVILLSNSMVKDFKFIAGSKTYESYRTKLLAIPNFIRVPSFNNSKKSKVVLFVGRMQLYAKRVDIAIYIADRMARKYPDWTFNFLGDGDYLKHIKEDLPKNIRFEGNVNPNSFYSEASYIYMTSSFEGFPMVLTEAMSYGVVPILFNSFSSATDIVLDGVNGVLIEAFNLEKYQLEFDKLLNIYGSTTFDKMSNSAKSTIINNYEYSIVGDKWHNLINDLEILKNDQIKK